jgi:hypothetical protein
VQAQLRLVHLLEYGLGDEDVKVVSWSAEPKRRRKAAAPVSGRDTPSRRAVCRWKLKSSRTKRPSTSESRPESLARQAGFSPESRFATRDVHSGGLRTSFMRTGNRHPVEPGETTMQSLTSTPTAIRLDLQESVHRALRTFARVSLGLIFFVAGLDGFIDVLPHPSKPFPERAILFAGALLKSGHLIQLLKGTELIAGAIFLSNRLVPLAVAIIAPVIVNILAFHLFLAPDGVPLAVILLALDGYLAWTCLRSR